MTLHDRIGVRIGELAKLVAEHEESARHFQFLGQTHRVQEHYAIARGYAQAKLELIRLVAGEAQTG